VQSLFKLLAHIAKSFGVSTPSDNARTATSGKEKQRKRRDSVMELGSRSSSPRWCRNTSSKRSCALCSQGSVFLMPKDEPYKLRNVEKQDLEILVIRLHTTRAAS
jgi:hypothetical protein